MAKGDMTLAVDKYFTDSRLMHCRNNACKNYGNTDQPGVNIPFICQLKQISLNAIGECEFMEER